MVLEALGPTGQGAVAWALAFVEETLQAPDSTSRPWVFVEAPQAEQLYVPAFSEQMREFLAQGQLLWVRAPRSKMAEMAQLLLSSGLCAGVFLRGLDFRTSQENAAVWSRRWQLASEKSGTHLLWFHEQASPGVGFAVRLLWSEENGWEIKKGYGCVETSPWKTLAQLERFVPGRKAKKDEKSDGKENKKSSPHPAAARIA